MNLYVVAGNQQQYHDCLRAMRTSPQAAVFVAQPDVLRGQELRPGQVVFFGTYGQRADLREILELVAAYTRLPAESRAA